MGTKTVEFDLGLVSLRINLHVFLMDGKRLELVFTLNFSVEK